ncbi:hypothetical protein CA13_10370 [Planctomycetes bacterium CA13]|uniref:Uncharacterized protein n=1 Tax=Novipirellula herctigrandis TaxID=2527986 RepID=A0A5C5YZ06_9BACT|nr:hypothetical protein CA13_10370 [Planctomycetes bacterium CA13]
MDDYPHYEAPNSNLGYFWLAKYSWTDFPVDYFTENYDDDDAEFHPFSADFRLGYYDHDIQETASTPDGSTKLVAELLRGSWASSYRNAVAEAAIDAG